MPLQKPALLLRARLASGTIGFSPTLIPTPLWLPTSKIFFWRYHLSFFQIYFLKVGAVRCWSAERLVSPLLLASCFPEYRDWCQVTSDMSNYFYVDIFQVKSEVDPQGLLGSGYIQGTITLDQK